MAKTSALEWLTAWRHDLALRGATASFGVATLDNPGWALKVFAPEEAWTAIDVAPTQLDIEGDAWMVFKMSGRRFETFGGPRTLGLLVGHLARFASGAELDPRDEKLDALMDWYAGRCDGDWEHDFGLRINSTEEGWEIIGNVANVTVGLATSADHVERWGARGVHVTVAGDRLHVLGSTGTLPDLVVVATELMARVACFAVRQTARRACRLRTIRARIELCIGSARLIGCKATASARAVHRSGSSRSRQWTIQGGPSMHPWRAAGHRSWCCR
ncbi:MAG: hypothetical protein JWP97_3011 [Labilithrix sp.]|nr:hypothetical protein [Labilithrix sp.]